MLISYTHVLTLLHILWSVNCKILLRSSLNRDVNYKDSIPVELIHHQRNRRSSSDHYDFSLNFHIHSKPVILKLQENTQLNSRIPTYIIRGNGSIIREPDKPDLQNTTYYYDLSNGASFYIKSNGSRKTHMYGTFHFDNEEYILEFKDNILTVVHKLSQENKDIYHFKIWKTPGKTRRKRDTGGLPEDLYHFLTGQLMKNRSPSYHVELLFVVDYSVYKHWFDISTGSTQQQKDANAKKSLKQFYAFVTNGMNGRYLSISPDFLSIVFAGLVISETPSASPWTEKLLTGDNVNAHNALNSFSEWVKKQKDLPSNDHAMLLTRYNLASTSSSSLEGYAYVGAICSINSQSIMEESDDYTMVTVAAHELGHSLGANHDGETGNGCNAKDFYIMAPSSNQKVGSSNPWRFSSCSVNYFKTTIQRLDLQNLNCLTSFGPSYNPNALSQYSGKLPGELISVDEQCKKVHGTGSAMCREHYKGDFSGMCGLMWCRDPNQAGTCRSMVPADGTLCGNKKWCLNGECVYSVKAASSPERCAQGDYVGSVDSGRTCTEIVPGNKKRCYEEGLGLTCCGSCALISTGVKGCLYGDRVPSSLCNKTACPYYSQEELKRCCGSCASNFKSPEDEIPTESDGTNEILIGVSVGILIIIVGIAVFLYRRGRLSFGGKKPLAHKNRMEKRHNQALPGPGKPVKSISNGEAHTSTHLISNPILNHHTNKNLRTNVENGSNVEAGLHIQNGTKHTKKFSSQPENKKTGSKTKSEKPSTGTKGKTKQTKDKNKGSTSNSESTSTKAVLPSAKTKNLAKSKDKQVSSPEEEQPGSIHDRIAALKHVSDKPTSEKHSEATESKEKSHGFAKKPIVSKKPDTKATFTQDKKSGSTVDSLKNKFVSQPLHPPSSDSHELQKPIKQASRPISRDESAFQTPVNKFDKKALYPPVKSSSGPSNPPVKSSSGPSNPPVKSSSGPSNVKSDISDTRNPVKTIDKKPIPLPKKTDSSGMSNPTSATKIDKKLIQPPEKPETEHKLPANKFEKVALRPPGKTKPTASFQNSQNSHARNNENV